MTKIDAKKTPLQDRLGAILGHFGGHLGNPKSSETLCFKGPRENPHV